MNIKVHRWPLKWWDGPKHSVPVRTAKPTGTLSCIAETDAWPRGGLIHVRFPSMQGVYDFRLSTGECTVSSMKDYVIDKDDLRALNMLKAEQLKAKAS